MKTINKSLYIILSLVCMVSLTSCNLFKKDELDTTMNVERIATLVESGTTIAVAAAAASNSKLVPHFKTAAVALTAAADGSNLSPEEVSQVIDRYLSNTGNYEIFIKQALSLSVSTYARFYEVNLGNKIQPHLKTVLLAVRDGIYGGIASVGDEDIVGATDNNPLRSITDRQLRL